MSHSGVPTSYSSIPYFLHGDLVGTLDQPSNLEEYLDVHYRYSQDRHKYTVQSSVSSEGKLHVWNTSLVTDNGLDDYYAFHLEFEEYKPILSLIPSQEACKPAVMTPPTASTSSSQEQPQQNYILHLVQAIAKFYDTDLKISQWPIISPHLKRTSFVRNQNIESVVFCDYVNWNIASLKDLELPKSLQPYKEDVVLKQLSMSLDETRRLCQNQGRIAVPALSTRDMDESISLKNINDNGDGSPLATRTNPLRGSTTSSPLASSSKSGSRRRQSSVLKARPPQMIQPPLAPVGLLVPLRFRDIDTKDCDALLLMYNARERVYSVREILSLSEAQYRTRFIHLSMALEDSWLFMNMGSSTSARSNNNNNGSSHHRHRSNSQPQQALSQMGNNGSVVANGVQPPSRHNSSSPLSAATGLPLEKSMHTGLSLYSTGAQVHHENGHEYTLPSLQINTSNNQFSSSSVHSWDSLSLTSSPIISPRNSASNIWSPSSPTAADALNNQNSIHAHLAGMHYPKAADAHKSGVNNRPRSFSSPLLFPNAHHHANSAAIMNQQQSSTLVQTQQHYQQQLLNSSSFATNSNGNRHTRGNDSMNHVPPSHDMGGRGNVQHFNPQQQQPGAPQLVTNDSSVQQGGAPPQSTPTAAPAHVSSNNHSSTNTNHHSQKNSSRLQQPHMPYRRHQSMKRKGSMKNDGNHSHKQKRSPRHNHHLQGQSQPAKLSDAQLEAKNAASNIPDSDPIWRYHQWQLLEMYDKIKKDYPQSPDLGTEAPREEIIYHMLRANFKWKCELCCRYNQQDPMRSSCRFRKSPWRCYFAHGSEDLRQKRKYF